MLDGRARVTSGARSLASRCRRGICVACELWEDAQRVAEARGETVSDEVRASLERYVKRNRNLLD